MIYKKVITEFTKTENPITKPITKFGGQPNWVTESQWPISTGWDNRPMMFIGQIMLDKSMFENTTPTMAYIFVTHPNSVDDDFFDPDIAEWNSGENAVIIQPTGVFNGKTIHMNNGPTVFDKSNMSCEFIPKLVDGEDPEFISQDKYTTLTTDEKNSYFELIDGNKIGGTPNFFQGDFPLQENWNLLLQLNSSFLPFCLNLGASPTMFVLINQEITEGRLFIQDM